MEAVVARVRVVAASLVTGITVTAMVLAIIATELAGLYGADHAAVDVVVRAAATLGAAVLVIRRVTPVLDQASGLLEPDVDVWTDHEVELLTALRASIAADDPLGPDRA